MHNKGGSLIEVKNVTKSFATDAGVVNILKSANFTIEKGSFTIIYGSSGSGKSTLLNMLMGLDAPTQGQIVYDGQDMFTQNEDELAAFRAQTRGIVQQTNYWIKSLSVIENVSMPLYFSGLTKQQAHERAMEMLKRVGMDSKAKRLPYVLSGGEQQRVAMARALAQKPTYILADEPTGNLDSKNGDMIINLLQEAQQNIGCTIVLVTHNLEYLPIATKILLIQDGVITASEGKDSRAYTQELMESMKQRLDKWSGKTGDAHA